MNIFIEKLKTIVKDRRAEGIPDFAIINFIKEELQYAVLDFIYNNKKYSNLIMYGGTLLRIAYDLHRMSEDLDFQTNKKFVLLSIVLNTIGIFFLLSVLRNVWY